MFLLSYFVIVIIQCFIIPSNAQTVRSLRSSGSGTARSTPEGEREYYEYDDDATSARGDRDRKERFFSDSTDILVEHADFVSLRLRHILNQTTTNIKQLREIQEEEFSSNEIYKEGWGKAKEIYNTSLRQVLRNVYPNGSIVHKVPEEYHIALIGYSMQYPEAKPLYTDFNEHTRKLCSGKDIMEYKYKSYFKLLELAVETLGQDLKLNYEGIPPKTPTRFLYRGVSRGFALKVGQHLAFQHFISTSINKTVAERFSGGGTVFEFELGKSTTSSLGAYLAAHSVFAGEEEMLLSPLQIFQVDSIHEGYVQLKSRPINDDFSDVHGSDGGGSRGQEVTVLASVLGVVVVISVTVRNRRRMSNSCFSFSLRETVSEVELT